MQRHLAMTLAAAAATALAACGSAPDSSAEWAGAVRDSARVTIVENSAVGLWQAGEAWQIVEDLRIGVAQGDPDYQFGQITGVDVDSDGRIYVLDQQAQEMRVFDAQGTFLHAVGGAGSGPGEFSPGAGPVLIGQGDTVLVPDVGLQRVNRFLPGGAEAGSFPLPIANGIPMAWAVAPDGRIVHQLRRFPMPGQPQPESSAGDVIVARGTDGSSDTLAVLPAGETFQMQGGAMRIRMFEPEPVWDIAADGSMLSAVNTEYSIEIRGPDGALTRVIRKPFERAPVTDADREAFLDLLREAWERAGVPPAARQQIEQSISFADFYPALARIKAGPASTVWVQRIKTAELVAESGAGLNFQDPGAPLWDVFDPDGRYLGVVEFPARFSLLLFDGDRVYGVMRDEFDVQYVALLRIAREQVLGRAEGSPRTRRG